LKDGSRKSGITFLHLLKRQAADLWSAPFQVEGIGEGGPHRRGYSCRCELRRNPADFLANPALLREVVLVKLWKWEPENLPSVTHSIRTAIAATVSLAVARLFGLPEAYWAAIATLVVMQSTLGATLLISIERIAATALGALSGALLASYFTGNLAAFAAAVFGLGLLCGAFRLEKSAYRYAGVTLAIILLIPRSNAAWIVGLHRFFEVSVGILVALALAAVWPEHQLASPKQSSE
jgi:uncharacterized membrane protein YccC